jgi:hypothetical protein
MGAWFIFDLTGADGGSEREDWVPKLPIEASTDSKAFRRRAIGKLSVAIWNGSWSHSERIWKKLLNLNTEFQILKYLLN